MRKILITFDTEEFDLPREFNCQISEERMYEISKKGLLNIINLLKKHGIFATFFVTANFAKRNPDLLKVLSGYGHEIASHGYDHSFHNQNIMQIKEAKLLKEKIIGKAVVGYRSPRFNLTGLGNLSELGFFYDSSIHPTFLPGRYNNFFKPRTIHRMKKLIEIPPSVLPIIRLPIFWLAFKNFPGFYRKIFARINFISSNYLMLVFHSWEFADLSEINIPKFIKRKHGREMLNMLEDYILFSKRKKYSFDTIGNFLEV